MFMIFKQVIPYGWEYTIQIKHERWTVVENKHLPGPPQQLRLN